MVLYTGSTSSMRHESESQLLSTIRTTIAQKGWYGYNADTGAFDWNESIAAIASQLGLAGHEQAVKDTIEQAYTPACLTTVEIEIEDGKKETVPLIAAICAEGIESFVWTMGDRKWQETKYYQSGAVNFIPEDHFIVEERDKISVLPIIFDRLGESGEPIYVIVVDDKQANTEGVKQLAHTYESPDNLSVCDYHLKLQDPRANPQAFYQFVQAKQRELPGTRLVVVFDFDGVVADTDSVLYGPAAENLEKLLISMH